MLFLTDDVGVKTPTMILRIVPCFALTQSLVSYRLQYITFHGKTN